MRNIIIIGIFLFCAYSLRAQEAGRKPDYLDPRLPVEKRVDDLVSRMTLEEKISQMENSAREIPRLQIPEYNWWNECLHGVARAGTATVFPQAIGLAATWDTDLLFRTADVISTEARAKYNDFIRKGDRSIFKGLTFWSPNINIFRDPRWGRGQETYGEDPYLTARMGVAFVKGLQGNDSRYLKTVATPKHYAVHSGPEPERHMFNAIVDNHDLYDTYLPAFEACIKEGGTLSVMCAYNRFMGNACCGSPLLLQHILRNDWHFTGYVVSDCGAINDISSNHKIVKTSPEAAALAVRSGTDLECGNVYDPALLEALKQGLLTEEEITRAVKRLFTARFKLGMFDPPELVPYAQIPIDENDSKEHRQLSIQAARESIVLLKNAEAILPLKKDLKRIAVVGPTADSYAMLVGNYNGTPSKFVTPLQGIKKKVGQTTEVIYEPGCDLIEEGAPVNAVTSQIVGADGIAGLKAEYFKNKNIQGEPFYVRIDSLGFTNWIYGARIPAFDGWTEFKSIRWSGVLKAPASGDFVLRIKSDGGYRLFIDGRIVLEDWTEHRLAVQGTHLHLTEGKSYTFKLECFQGSRRPQLFVQWELPGVDYFKKAIDLAKNSDVILFVGGITAQLEGEQMPVDYDGFNGGDRTSLDIPKVQEHLLKALHATGKPIVLVLTSGSALSVHWEKQNIPAIIQLWYPGQEGGTALADVLLGDYNPAGRLPVTFYRSVDQLPPFEDYRMKGRTYRYFEGEPLFAFGYGLSYTKFRYENLIVPKEIEAGTEAAISVQVQNVGKIEGDEVVQLYIKNLTASAPTPIHSLQSFKRIHLQPGERQIVEFKLQPRQLAEIIEQKDTTGVQFVEKPGAFEIAVGGALPGTQPSSTEVIVKKMDVVGSPLTVDE